MLKELKIQMKNPITLQIDDKSAINLGKSPLLHGRGKYIEARFSLLKGASKQC